MSLLPKFRVLSWRPEPGYSYKGNFLTLKVEGPEPLDLGVELGKLTIVELLPSSVFVDHTKGPPKIWRRGRSVGRTLYIDDQCVGMVDTPELAASIVEAMNVVRVARK